MERKVPKKIQRPLVENHTQKGYQRPPECNFLRTGGYQESKRQYNVNISKESFFWKTETSGGRLFSEKGTSEGKLFQGKPRPVCRDKLFSGKRETSRRIYRDLTRKKPRNFKTFGGEKFHESEFTGARESSSEKPETFRGGGNLPWEIKPSRNLRSLEGNHSKKKREYSRKTLQRNQRPLEGNHFREPETNVTYQSREIREQEGKELSKYETSTGIKRKLL